MILEAHNKEGIFRIIRGHKKGGSEFTFREESQVAKRGRKNKYATHVEPRLAQIEAWIGKGLTEAEVCKRLGIGVRSFARYKYLFWQLRHSIKKGHQVENYKVEKTLFKSAIGFFYEVTKIITDNKLGRTRIEETIKFQKPDVKVQIFWLTNRDPERWKRRR